eukprot:1075103-Rhodomonas_salina.3
MRLCVTADASVRVGGSRRPRELQCRKRTTTTTLPYLAQVLARINAGVRARRKRSLSQMALSAPAVERASCCRVPTSHTHTLRCTRNIACHAVPSAEVACSARLGCESSRAGLGGTACGHALCAARELTRHTPQRPRARTCSRRAATHTAPPSPALAPKTRRIRSLSRSRSLARVWRLPV